MIISNIENIERFSLPQSKFLILLDYIKSADLSSFSKGKFEIDGDDLFGIGLEYTTKPIGECLWEAHRRYIDIHYILEGQELIHISDISGMKVSKIYDAENDYELFEGEKEHSINLKQGMLLVLSPNEVHKTSIILEGVCYLKKIVFKLKLEDN